MRYLTDQIRKDLSKKMVFVGGPRQAGKTTLARALLKAAYEDMGLYLNWDDERNRKIILERTWKQEDRLVIFDELHKYGRWKSWLKVEDATGHTYRLQYLRDREGREVDFVIVKDGKVDALVEAKWADDKPSKALTYYANKLQPRRVLQIVGKPIRGYDTGGIRVRPATEFFLTIDADV